MKNVASFIRVPAKHEVEPTQEDRQNFLVAVLNGIPFYKEYRIDNLRIKFSSPSIDIFRDEIDVEQLFFDCLEEVQLEGLIKEGNKYKKNQALSFEERKRVLSSINQKSPLVFVLVQMFYHFIFLFQKLVEEVIDKGFFATVSTEQSSKTL